MHLPVRRLGCMEMVELVDLMDRDQLMEVVEWEKLSIEHSRWEVNFRSKAPGRSPILCHPL